MTVDELEGPAGSVGQVRESALRLMELPRKRDRGHPGRHVTRTGRCRTQALEHLVDAVLSLEGERTRLCGCSGRRRIVSLHRGGRVFEMAEAGLVEVRIQVEPSSRRARKHRGASSGPLWRDPAMLVEVQALVAPAATGRRVARPPASTAIGWRCSWRSWGAGRRRPGQPRRLRQSRRRSDSGRSRPGPAAGSRAGLLPPRPAGPHDLVAVGEVGLLGELRAVPGLERGCARRPGSASGGGRAAHTAGDRAVQGIEIVAAANLREAIGHSLAGAGEAK